MTETCTYKLIEQSVNGQPQNSALPLTEELNKMSDCEVINEESALSCGSEGIQASDIGSLLEQFLEYEQGSDADPSSYPNSSYMTPCGSPRESDDVVLGRLMIVQEKLSQEVYDDTPPSTPIHNGGEAPPSGQKILKRKLGSLARTINGIHPKGDNIRMADSPKFAKFKKKRLNNEPPLRRCVSGSTTPKTTSPSDLVSPEEKKRREAKLIEALALTFPHNKKSGNKGNVEKANKKLNTTKSVKQSAEPLPSRMMPVVSKRFKNNNDSSENKTLQENHSDPRLNRPNYGENSNTTHLADIGVGTEESSRNLKDVPAIVDMTIDHEALAVVNANKNITKQTEEIKQGGIKKDSNNKKNEKLDIIEPKVEVVEACAMDSNLQNKSAEIVNHLDSNLQNKTTEIVNHVEIKEEPLSDDNSAAKTKPKKKMPKNYRKTKNFHDAASSQESTEAGSSSDDDDDDREYRNRYIRRRSQSPSPRRSRPHLRSRNYSRSTSRSPRRYRSYSRSYSGSCSSSSSRSRSRSHSRSGSPLDRSRLYGVEYSQRSPRSEIDKNVSDIKEKLIELSNPVPYDIEHERKVQFLTGVTTKGNFERRNIYVGGIDRLTSKFELAERFRRFGEIEKITLHFRTRGDNYAFIVYERAEDATRAIEEGNDDPKYPKLELCFGGRRKFVGGSYVDFDGNTSYLEESDLSSRSTRCPSPENDYDELLKMALAKTKKREVTPEWT